MSAASDTGAARVPTAPTRKTAHLSIAYIDKTLDWNLKIKNSEDQFKDEGRGGIVESRIRL